MTISRRQFLQRTALTASAAGSMAIAPLSLASAKEESAAHVAAVRNAWDEQGLGCPITHLHQRHLLHATANMSAASQQDFNQGKTLDVDGLLLSQVESAFLLFLHSGKV